MKTFLASLALAGATAAQAGLHVDKLAEGIYAVTRTEPPGLMFDCNVAFIVSEEDVIVVDANLTPSSAAETIKALRKITQRPVRYVVNTHWHIDHVGGNATWREAYPGVEFIGHASAREDMATTGEANRREFLEGAPGFAARLRENVAKKVNFAGKALTDEERAAYLADAGLVENYVKEGPGIEPVLPTIGIEQAMIIQRGGRAIEIRYLGAGHSRADLVVWIPDERVLIAGDLVVYPVPLVGSTSFPSSYAQALTKLAALKARVILPGHGPLLWNDDYVWTEIHMLESLVSQVKAAVARGETLEEAGKSVSLEKYRAVIAGDSAQKNFIFRNYVVGSGIPAAYAEAKKGSEPFLPKGL